MRQRTRNRDRIDYKIMFMVICLSAFGLVMIYSIASAQDKIYLFLKQAACLIIGFALVCLIHRFHWVHTLIRNKILVFFLYGASVLSILALLLPKPITHSANGATRWLNLRVCYFQVADLVKIGVILAIALWVDYAYYRKGVVEEIIFVVVIWLLGGIPAGLILIISSDLSSAMVIAGIAFIMSFVASRNKTGLIMHIGIILLLAAVIIFCVIYVMHNMPTEAQLESGDVSYRIGRIAAWIDPERYANTIAYQPLHCYQAIANGGLFGKGLGQSWQKSIIPESENDVIFAIVIEELGIFGGSILLLLFGVLFFLIIQVSGNIPSQFRKMMTLGVGVHLMLQTIIHCAVCINLIPNTGIGLPFISSGMTAGFLQMGEILLVLSTTRMVVFSVAEPRQYCIDLQTRLANQKFMIGKPLRLGEARKNARKKAMANHKADAEYTNKDTRKDSRKDSRKDFTKDSRKDTHKSDRKDVPKTPAYEGNRVRFTLPDRDVTSGSNTTTGRSNNRNNSNRYNTGSNRNNTGNTRNNYGSTKNNTGNTRNNGGSAKNNGGSAKNNGGSVRNNGGNTRNNTGNTRNNGGNTRNNTGNTRNNGGNTRNNGGNTRNYTSGRNNSGRSTRKVSTSRYIADKYRTGRNSSGSSGSTRTRK